MINITFPDNNSKQFKAPITGLDIATSISKSLEKKAVAVRVDGTLKDLNIPILHDAKIEIITADSDEGIDIIRHDTAHLLAQAVKELYPETQVTIGPTIENGFYYDFSRSTPFTIEDLALIEAHMKKIAQKNEAIIRKVVSREEATAYFEKLGEKYKVEIIKSLSENEEISLYFQGDFADLCRGPHSPSTGKIKAFKLLKVAGAYWRGDNKNEMLQRIYGTAWGNEEQLKNYLHQLEEAEKRDHRKLGKELDLFHIQESSPGMVFWHEKGWQLYQIIEQYIRAKLKKHGYIEVKTPVVVDKSLWEASGHWEKFRENMFVVESEDKTMAIKPMSCPCHVQIFNHGLKSYRDLPLRMAEFGYCHRNESSGSLHGIMRVRGFNQDDAHIFCSEDMISSETIAFCDLLKQVYKDFGFEDIRVKFSDRPTVRAGSDKVWDKAENSLKEAVIAAGLEYTLNPGEGAFYGPKLEFVLKDAIGRDWQLGTLQVDFILPERLNANYIAADGNKYHPVMLHRAIIGTFERFIGILIEHHSGKFPLWLAPIQVAIATITSDADQYALHVKNTLESYGIRCVLDTNNDKISYKVRKHSLAKIPLIAVMGKNEQLNQTLSVRALGNDNQETLALNEFVDKLVKNAKQPTL